MTRQQRALASINEKIERLAAGHRDLLDKVVREHSRIMIRLDGSAWCMLGNTIYQHQYVADMTLCNAINVALQKLHEARAFKLAVVRGADPVLLALEAT